MLKAYVDGIMAQADVVRWNELSTPEIQEYVRTRPGWGFVDRGRSANAVSLSWRKSVFNIGEVATVKTHGGVLHVTPTRWIAEDELILVADSAEPVEERRGYVDQGTHSVHRVESGGMPRTTALILGQIDRAKKHFTVLYSRLRGKRIKPDRPLVGSGDLNVNYLAEKRRAAAGLPLTPWFPYTGLQAVPGLELVLPSKPTHGTRLIDWGWKIGDVTVLSVTALPAGTSDHHPVLTVIEL